MMGRWRQLYAGRLRRSLVLGIGAWPFNPACAAEPITPPAFGSDPLDIGAVFLGLAGLVLSAGFAIFAQRAARLAADYEAQALKLAASLEDAESLLAVQPIGGIVLEPNGRDRSVGIAAQLLGRTGAVSLADLYDMAQPAELARLQPLVERLRGQGERFNIHLRLADRRILQIEGRPTGARVVVWLTDVTRAAGEVQRLSAALTEAETERDATQDVMDQAPFAMWRRDATGLLVWANQGYLAVVEAASLEAARDIDSLDGPNAPLPEAGKPTRERRAIVVDGTRRAVDIVRVALAGQTFAYAQDVTDLAEAELVLRRHIEAHAETLDRLSTPVAIFGPDKRLEFYNRAFSQLWRLPEDWLATKPQDGEILETLRERRRLPEQADWRAFKRQRLALYTQTIEPREELWHLPDGTTLKITGHPHPFGGLLFVYEDVSERLRLESSYNTLIGVQRQTLDHLFEGVAVFGSDARLKLFNPAYARIWHLDQSMLRTEPHVDEIAEHCRARFHGGAAWADFKQRLLSIVSGRQPVSGRLEWPDGAVVDFAGVPLPDGGTLLSYLDVSDTIRVERTLRERNEALETADRLKSNFIANVSSQLRAPMERILAIATSTDSVANAVAEIEESAANLATLLDDILELANLDAGHVALDPQDVEIAPLFADAAVSIAARAREMDLIAEIGPYDNLGRAWLDARRVRQILVHIAAHLMRNAPAGATLRLSVAPASEGLVFAVGLATGHRSDPSDAASDSDMDLTLVQRLVDLHAGVVEFTQEPEGGPRIEFVLATGRRLAA
jgi:signal transduction histidine kinase